MSQQNIDFGSFPDDPSADAIRTAFQKVQNNFTQLFNANSESAVLSVNNTPSAGITVNSPTGNVVVSANIACVRVSTTSLVMGTGADNTKSNATIVNSSQTLNIDINPAVVQSNYFADVGNNLSKFNGTLTANSNSQPNITTIGTLTGLNVSGNASFTGSNVSVGNVANLHIPGGSAGYVLATNGSGNLFWSAVATGNGSPGGLNSYVQFNNTGGFGGSANFTFDSANDILTVDGNIIANNIVANTLTGAYANGNSSISISSNNYINLIAISNTTATITDTGINVAGYVNASGNINSANANLGNLVTANYFSGDGHLLSNLSIGNASVSNANYASFAGVVTTNAQPNITSVGNLTGLTVNGNANTNSLTVNGNTIITGNLEVQGNAIYYNVTSFDVEDPIISLGGGPNGNALITNDGKDRGIELQYYTTTPVTAFMGWTNANSEFAFGSNITLASNGVVIYNSLGNVRGLTWLGNATGGFANFANANLGNSANANYFVGNLYGQANTASTAGTVTTNAQPNINSVGTLTSLTVTGNTTSGNFVGTLANGNSNINILGGGNINFNAVGVSIANITGTGINVAGTGNFTGNLSASAFIGVLANGNSNVSIPSANGNVVITAVGNSTLIVTGTNVNVAGSLTATGNITANNFIGNVVGNISGNITVNGSNTQVLFNDNGNANATAGFTFNKTSNLVTMTGNLITANANLGNAATANYFIGSGNNLSNIQGANVTGAVAYATTANAVAGANVTGAVAYATTANAVAGANVTGAVSYATTANSVAAANITGTINLANYATTANSVAGANVTGAVAYATTANSVAGANVSGTVANANNSAYLNTYTQSSSNTGNTIALRDVNGNLSANYFIGNGSQLTGITVGAGSQLINGNSNVTVYGNSNIAISIGGTANTAVFTSTGVNVSGYTNLTGNLTSGNANLGNAATANYFIGSGNNLSNIQGANISGNVGNALNAYAVAGANVTGAVAYATTANAVAGANVTGQVGNALVAGTVYGNAQGNITSVGTLTGLSVNGTLTAVNITANTGLITGTLATAAQPNITSVGTLTSLAVTGNISGANITASAYHIRSVGTGISAAGSTQGTATTLTKEINVVSTVSSGQGVILPTAVAGMVIHITNTSANALLVYPASSGIINSLSANAGYTQGAGATITYIAPTTTQWYTGGATYS